MMNKLMFVALTSALSCSVHAGMMGGDLNNAGFIALEGGYVTNQFKNFNFTFQDSSFALSSVKKDKKYGGRLAAGLLFMMDDQSAMTSEIGWGYYGETTLNSLIADVDALSIKYTLYGFDVLVGLAYIQPSYSLSFKAGALIQTLKNQTIASFADPTDLTLFVFNAKTNQTAALPEIKLGAAYNFDTNWSLTGSFFYAIGTSPSNNGVFSTQTFGASLVANSQNPTVAGFFLGVQYTC